MPIKQFILLFLTLYICISSDSAINYPFEIINESRVTVQSVTSPKPFIITNNIFYPNQTLIVTLKGNDITYVSQIFIQINKGPIIIRSESLNPHQYIAKDATYSFIIDLFFNYCKNQNDTAGIYTINVMMQDMKYRSGQIVANLKFNLRLDDCITIDTNACPGYPCPKSQILKIKAQ